MSRVSESNVGSASTSVADVAAAGSCRRLSGGNDASAAKSDRDGGMAGRVRPFSSFDIPEGDEPCTGECGGAPEDYMSDYGVCCPDCLGLGHRPSIDDGDYEGAFFDPHGEWGTMPRLHGHGRGQI